MDLNQLQYFRVVAQMEHITNAANALHITQPALSKIISRVEEYAGAPLFDRVRGKLKLNECGRIFLERVDAAFGELNAGIAQIQQLTQCADSLVTAAATFDNMMFVLIQEFFAAHPNVKIRYDLQTPEEIRTGFQTGELDFALVTEPLEGSGLDCRHISDEEILLLVNDTSRLAGKTSVTFQELERFPLMCESQGDGMRPLIDACFAQAGVKPTFVLESSESAARNNFAIGMKYAACFTPAHRFMQIQQSDANTHLHALHLREPTCQRSTYLVRSTQKPLGSFAQELYNFTWDYFTELDREVRAYTAQYMQE